ncbi:MAG: UbiD family decarboxylase, partial [Anaerolineales bacterium]|nr:UbiD family decarboxylase [Anaerolineales bacterium]
MSFRSYLQRLQERGALVEITAPISKQYEIAGVLKQLEPAPVLFHQVQESPFRVAGNLFCSKASFADYFGITVQEIIPFLAQAIDQRSPPEVVTQAPCQEVII